MWKYFIVISIALAVVAFAANRKQSSVVKDADIAEEQAVQEEDVGQEVQSFSVSGYSPDGKNRWQVEGESADIFSDVVDMHTIKINSYGEQTSVVLTADEGTFFKNSKDVELRKNVIANTDEGTTLKTDKLQWKAEVEKITTDDYVYIEREDIAVSGTGAEASPSIKKVWLNQDIKMDLKPSTIITCDGPLEVDYQNNVSYFNKNVVIEDEQGRVFADRVTAYIDPEQKRVYKAIASGNVKITHQQNVSYSEEAIYLPDEGKAILVGRPKVVIYSVDKLQESTKKDTETEAEAEKSL